MAAQGIEFAKLPSVTNLDDIEAMKQIVACLEELDTLVAEKSKILGREDQLRDKLQQLQEQTGRTGFRYGLLCFTAQNIAGRKTLDKMLLMENGCPAAVINASYKEGEPSVRCSFRRLKEDEV